MRYLYMTTEGKINRYKFFSYYEETAYKLKDNHFLSLKSGSIFFLIQSQFF